MYSIVFMRGLRKSPLKGFTWQRLLVETMGKVYNLINSCDKRCIFLLVEDWTATSSFSEKSLATFCENRSISAIFKRVRKSMPKKDIQNGRVWGPGGIEPLTSEPPSPNCLVVCPVDPCKIQNPESKKQFFPIQHPKLKLFGRVLDFGFWTVI